MSLKITVIFLALYVLAAGLSYLIVNSTINNNILNQTRSRLNGYHQTLSALGAEIWQGDTEELEKLRSEFERSDTRIALTDRDGAVIWETGGVNLSELRENASQHNYTRVGRVVYMLRIITSPGGEISLFMATDMTGEYERVDGTRTALLWALIFSGFFIVIPGGIAGTAVITPIKKLTKETRTISSDSIDKRLDEKAVSDELKELACAINRLLDNIQEAIESQERFVCDASHELRTPVSVIKGYSSMLKRWGYKDKAILRESMDAIEKETDNMSALLENLLLLSKSDRDVKAIDYDDFSLDELVDEIVKEENLATKESHIIEITDIRPTSLKASRSMIKQLIRIILDNAVRYTPKGGYIGISCYREEQNAYIIVDDKGIGIAQKDLPKIFDRFYRADRARTRESGGNGLGLSIARKIADAHGGEIMAESKTGYGTKITIVIPVKN
jgi:signal transduction histidine kinase